MRRIRTKSSQWDPNLVLHARMQEGPREIAFDYSGSSNHGKIIGAAWGSPGLVFDGVDDYVDCGNAASLNPTTAITVEAWVYPISKAYYINSAAHYGPSGYPWILRTSQDGNGMFTPHITTGGISTLMDTGWPVSLNKWSHLVFTYNGTTFAAYGNGVFIMSIARTGAILTTADPITIGASASSSEYFSGTIDEVRIYNRALSASEILTRYNSTKSKYGL